MENTNKKHRVYLKNKKLRTRFKNSFANPFFRLIPYDIWQMILMMCHLRIVGNLAQLCKCFGEFVEEYRMSTFTIALAYRKECQMALAEKYLRKFAKNNNQEAMFHLAMAYRHGGWKIQKHKGAAKRWFIKLAETGNLIGAIFSDTYHKFKFEFDSCSNYEKGWCYYHGIGGVETDYEKSIEFFEKSAEDDNNEFAQHRLAEMCDPNDIEKKIYFAKKAAEQGYKPAQELLFHTYRKIEDYSNALYWIEKSSIQ